MDTAFRNWLRRVDIAVSGISGLTTADLADMPYRDWFDSGYSPSDAAMELLSEEGFPFEDEYDVEFDELD